MNGLLKKFIDFAWGNIIVLILGLLSSSIITRIITPTENGKFSMFNTITSLIILVVIIGMDQAYIRYYYEEEEKDRGSLLRRCIKLPLIINLSVGILALFLYKPISTWLVEETSLIVVLLLLVHSTFNVISKFVLVNVRMKQKGKLYSSIIVMNKICYLIFVAIFYFFFKDNYMTLILSFVLANIAMVIIGMTYERKDWFNKECENELKTPTKTLLAYGAPFIFSMAITWIFQSIDKISIKVFADSYEVGLYAGAMNIIGILNTLQGSFTTFWTPIAYERYNKEPNNKKFFIDINQIVSLVMLLISIGVIATKDIIVMLLGSQYRETAFIFPFLVFMPIMYTISETTVLGINFNKKTKYHIYIAIFSATSNIIGNILLVPKMGAVGAAISTGLSYIVFFIARTYFSNKFYKIKFNLNKLWISVISIYILAWYSSLHKFNLIILILTVFATATVLLCYKNVIKDIFYIIKNVIKNKSNSI